MNDKLEYDHFNNTEELLQNIDIWYKTDDIDYTRWFGLNDLNNLRIYINRLQSNWNSLREWLEDERNQQYSKFIPDYSINNWVLDKMNELESSED